MDLELLKAEAEAEKEILMVGSIIFVKREEPVRGITMETLMEPLPHMVQVPDSLVDRMETQEVVMVEQPGIIPRH
jgi:hypothetical protein